MLQTRLISGHLQYCRHFVLSWMHLYMFAQLIYGNPCIPWSGQNFGPNSTWSVQDSLNTADAHGQDCPQPLINSTTGHYSSTCTHSTSLWLAFLANLQQGRAWNKALNCTNNHFHAYQKYIRNTDASQFQTGNGSPCIWCLLRRSYWTFFTLFIWSMHGIVDCILKIPACVKLAQLYAIVFLFSVSLMKRRAACICLER